MVTVKHGVNSNTFDVAGKTVGEVREQLADIMNIPETAQIRVNGQPAGEDHVLGENAQVEFVKVAGEKGA